MPANLATLFKSAGHNIETVSAENLSGASDEDVFKRAVDEQRIFFTFDLDFANIRKFPIGQHSGIVVFRLHDQRWPYLQPKVESLLKQGVLELLQGGLAIVEDSRVRYRKPKKENRI